jgi:hypothetical protein
MANAPSERVGAADQAVHLLADDVDRHLERLAGRGDDEAGTRLAECDLGAVTADDMCRAGVGATSGGE